MRVSLLLEIVPGDGVVVERDIDCPVGAASDWLTKTAKTLLAQIERRLTDDTTHEGLSDVV